MNKAVAIAIMTGSLVLAGCTGTNSLPVNYQTSPNPDVVMKNAVKIGVVEFKDNRRISKNSDPLLAQTVLKIEGSTVGITYKNKEYAKLTNIIRSELINELRSTGATITKINTLPANGDSNLLTNIAKPFEVDVVVYGVLDSFESYCEARFIYLCDSQVTLVVTALRSDGSEIIIRESFSQTKTEHKLVFKELTNILVNELMKSVVQNTTAELVKKINNSI
jgi:hypothetical protein